MMMEKCMVCGRVHFWASMEWELGLPYCELCHDNVFVPGVDKVLVTNAILKKAVLKHDAVHCPVMTPFPQAEKKTRHRLPDILEYVRAGSCSFSQFQDRMKDYWASVPFATLEGVMG